MKNRESKEREEVGGAEDGERKRKRSGGEQRMEGSENPGARRRGSTHLGSLLRMAAAGELGLMFFTGLSFTWVGTAGQKVHKNRLSAT